MPWVKGQSGNKRGRPPETIEVKEVRRLAQARTHEAFAIIESLMTGAERESVRLAAALSVLRIAGMDFNAGVMVNVHPPANPTSVPTVELESGLAPEGTVQ